MPLPALDLDTRRWDDLVDEARTTIPRLAPEWTDHNVHDPGITIVELLAYLLEQDLYRVNRVPERHRRKFLALLGFSPKPPHPSRGAVAFSLRQGAAPLTLPAGVAVGRDALPFRTTSQVVLTDVQIATVQTYDGRAHIDATRAWRDGLPFEPFGHDPSTQAALLVGFDASLPVGQAASLWLGFEGALPGERQCIVDEQEQQAAACAPPRPPHDCAGDDEQVAAPTTLAPLVHHSLRTVWEFFAGSDWHAVDAIADETRGFSLDGTVRVELPAAMTASAQGAVPDARFYLRCRIVGGAPDVPPVVLALALNGVEIEQRYAVRQTFTLAPGPAIPAATAPAVGQESQLELLLDNSGNVTSLAFGAAADGPGARVLDYVPRTPTVPGSLTVTLGLAGRGSGLPNEWVELPDAQVADGDVAVWAGEAWEQRDDLDAARRTEAVFMLDPLIPTLSFGDGERGRVVAAGEPVYAAYDVTAGSIATSDVSEWTLAGVDDGWNRAVTGLAPAALAADVGVKALVHPAGGAGAEPLAAAEGRAAAAVWAHERLLDLCPAGTPQTLDQVSRADVLSRVAPARAATLLDFERLALEVPGVRVLRARAWGATDPRDACFRAPGTIAIVVLAGLPRSHPEPTDELLDAVWRYLNRRRVIGTRLRVVGPTYVEVAVDVHTQSLPGADPGVVSGQIRSAVARFLDPLVGGPAERGWPFGRDLYRSEIFELIDGIPGVDHVTELTLTCADADAGCANVCIPPAALPRASAATVVVEPS
jgi:predicted phage baseplate assembly protein